MDYNQFQFLKDCSGMRQAITEVINGINIYWDGCDWRLAKDIKDVGVIINEKMVDAILNTMNEGESNE